MLYLSRIILDTRYRQVRQDLGNCHHLHRRVLQGFATAPDDRQARVHFSVLYRTETYERDPRLVRLLVQSTAIPVWERLPDTYVAAAPDGRGNPAVRLVDHEYNQIQSAMQLRFRLRANPTRRIGNNNTDQGARWRGKRIELYHEADQLAWLERKGQQGGFRLVHVAVRPELPDTRVTNQEKARGRCPAKDGRPAMPLTFGAVLFEGYMEVTDRAQFLTTIRVGIGSGKAFGFGLLSVATTQ